MLLCSAVPKGPLTRPNSVCPWRAVLGEFQSLTMDLWSFSLHCHVSTILLWVCLIHRALCYRGRTSQEQEIMARSSQHWCWNQLYHLLVFIIRSWSAWLYTSEVGKMGSFQLFFPSAGEDSFSHKILRKPVNLPEGHSFVSREFWVVQLLRCLSATVCAWGEMDPLCF